MTEKKNISEQFAAYIDPLMLNTLLDVKVGTDQTTILAGVVIRPYIEDNYGFFYCDNIVSKWRAYQSLTKDDFARALNAYNTVYNPLMRDESHTRESVETEKHGTESKTHTPDANHNTTTTAALDGTKTDTLSTTFENTATPRLDNRVETSGGTVTTDDNKYTDDISRTDTSMAIGDNTVSGHDIKHKMETYTDENEIDTPQNQILSEIALRLNPVSKQYIDNFIQQYCYYAGGCDIW